MEIKVALIIAIIFCIIVVFIAASFMSLLTYASFHYLHFMRQELCRKRSVEEALAYLGEGHVNDARNILIHTHNMLNTEHGLFKTANKNKTIALDTFINRTFNKNGKFW